MAKEKLNSKTSSDKEPKSRKESGILSKMKSFILAILITTGCSSPESLTTEKIIIPIEKEGTTLSTIVKDSLGLPEEITSDLQLRGKIIDEIAKENNITDINKIELNDTLTIDMDSIYSCIEKYQIDNKGNKDQGNKSQGEKKEQKESEKINPYTTISSMAEVEKSNNYLIKNVFNDRQIRGKFIEALKNGYKIHFLNPIETKDSPTLTVDEITKPKEILGNELEGKKFVLDPGHGSLDIGSAGLAQYGDASRKEKVIVYESAVMMDLVYRVARELRAHGAEVELTHYMNRRGIMDTKDLPPCLKSKDNKGNEVYQDIWNGTDKNSAGEFFKKSSEFLAKRAKIANKYNPNLYISRHADIKENKEGVIDSKSEILSIKYDKGQNNPESRIIAEKLLKNGFGYYYNGELVKSVKRDVVHQGLGALKPAKAPAILIETGNISNEHQAYILRESSNRQRFAENFVSVLIKTYNKNVPSIKSNKSKQPTSSFTPANPPHTQRTTKNFTTKPIKPQRGNFQRKIIS